MKILWVTGERELGYSGPSAARGEGQGVRLQKLMRRIAPSKGMNVGASNMKPWRQCLATECGRRWREHPFASLIFHATHWRPPWCFAGRVLLIRACPAPDWLGLHHQVLQRVR